MYKYLEKQLPPYETKISIIVPVFNMELYLEECIESILNQDLDNYEIILVNDGSSDKSQKIINEYCSRNSDKCFSITQENKGLGPARNTGLHMARGKYIMFVDSDDWLEDNVLGSLYEFMERYEFDLAVFDAYITEGKMSERVISSGHISPSPIVCKKEAIKNSTTSAHVWKRIYRHDLIKGKEFLSIWFEDIGFTPIVTSYANKIGYFKVPVYNYRQRKNSITTQNEDRRNIDVIKAWEYALQYSNNDYKKEVRYSIIKSINIFLEYRPIFAKEYNHFRSILSKTQCPKETDKSFPKPGKVENRSRCCLPKLIHCCYFNGNDISEELKANIQKWRQDMLGFDLHIWDRNTFNVLEVPFSQQAYTKKCWGKLTDYVAIKILYEYGGIFLNNCVTSVLLPEFIPENQILIGVNIDGSFNTSVIGSAKGNPLFKDILGYYETQNLISLKGELKDIKLLPFLLDIFYYHEDYFARVEFSYS